MNKKSILLPLTLLALAGCGSTPAASSVPASTSTPATSSFVSSSYKEIDDVPAVASGKYYVGGKVYVLDKATKKVALYDYDRDYAKLLADQGTKVFEESIRFVEEDGVARILFTRGEETHFLYAEGQSFRDQTRVFESGYARVSTATMTVLPANYVAPTYGEYVSDRFTQDKLDPATSSVIYSSGYAVKESFYLFLKLSATKAEIYVSDNPETHGDTPLHQVENYKTTFGARYLGIDVPHSGGEFACHLEIREEKSIHFVNSFERKGDYSASGNFTLVE